MTFNLGPDLSGNGFRAGDFWTFAARTADGSVEPPNRCSTARHLPPLLPSERGELFRRRHGFRFCRLLFPSLANPAIHVAGVYLQDVEKKIQNGGTGTIQKTLVSGITVACDAPVDPAIVTQPATQMNSPICSVTVDLPAPVANGGGFSPLILPATVNMGSTSRGSSTIKWTPAFPSPAALTNLEAQFPIGGPPVLAHLNLKGNSIWALGNPNMFLNGAVPEGSSGDGRASADFNMWFWLTSQPAVTLSANSLAFTTPQNVGTTSLAQTITLTFNGTPALATLTINSIAATGDFAVTNTCGGSVAAGKSCTISVTFTPTGTGTRTGQIGITENADSTPLVIALTGTGIAPVLTLSPPA